MTPVVDQAAHHDEQAGEEHQRRPLDVLEVASGRDRRDQDQQRPRRGGRPPTARGAGTACVHEGDQDQDRARRSEPDEEAPVADRLALVERHHRRRRAPGRTWNDAPEQPAAAADEHDQERPTTIGARWTRKSLKVRPAAAGDDDVRRVADQGGRAADVARPSPRRSGTGTGSRPSRSQTRSVTGATSSTVVTLSSSAEATPVISDQDDHHPERACPRALGRPDREVLEDAGLLEDADDEHHPEQQEDDVPVDPRVLGEEDLVPADSTDGHHRRRHRGARRACGGTSP